MARAGLALDHRLFAVLTSCEMDEFALQACRSFANVILMPQSRARRWAKYVEAIRYSSSVT